MKKRIGTMLLAALMMALTVVNPALAADTSTPTLEVQTIAAKPGQEVTLKVDVKNNPGFCAAKLTVNYDTSILELKGITMGEKFDSGTPVVSSNAIAFYYSYDKTNNGTLLELKFKVKEEAADGKTQVGVSYTEGDICNRNEQDVTFGVTQGGVNVTNTLTASISAEFTDAGRSLSLSEIVYINQYVYIKYQNTNYQYVEENGGLLIFKDAVSKENATYEKAKTNGTIKEGLIHTHYSGPDNKGEEFAQQSMGIPAKYYDQVYTLVVYLKLDNGEYIYSDPMKYSVNTYCNNVSGIEKPTEQQKTLKEVCSFLKEYGSKAKEYFTLYGN